MSLNDEAIDDLNAESDYLTHEEGKVASVGDVTVNASDDGEGVEVKNPDNITALIDQEDIKIKTVTDSVETYHTYGEVADTILAQESISQSDSQYVEQHMPGLYENVSVKQGFTEGPTRVNLDKTKAYVSGQLESQRQAAIQVYNTYIQKQSASVALQKNALLTKTLSEMLDELERLRNQAVDDLSVTSISKNLVSVEVSDSTTDGIKQVTSKDLRTCCINSIAYGGETRINPKIVADISNLLRSQDIEFLYKLTKQQVDHIAVTEEEVDFTSMVSAAKHKLCIAATNQRENHLATYQDLLMFYSTAGAIRLLEYLGRIITAIPNEFEQLDSLDEVITQSMLIHNCSVIVGSATIIIGVLDKLNTSAEAFMNAMREIA